MQKPPPKSARPYQIECGRAVLKAWFVDDLRRLLIVMPTGCGKSLTVSLIARAVYKRDPRPVLWLAHREELLHQAAQALREAMPWALVDIEQGSIKARPTSHVICASMQTLGREGCERLQWLADRGPSLVVIDEAHRGAKEGNYERICERFGCFDERATRLLGCTATPARLDGKPLVGPHGEALFESQVFTYSLPTAIREGYLCPIRGYRVQSDVDLSGIGTVAGDFNQGQLSKAVNTESRTNAAVKHWKEVASDRITAVFCVDREHSRNAAQSWKEAGFSAAYVDGAMDKDTRRDTLRMWRTGEIQVVASCALLTEGFDYPKLDCVVMLAPTQSWTRYCQSIGRGTRIADGKLDCLVIDVADNTSKHQLGKPPFSLARAVGLPCDVDLDGGAVMDAKEAFDSLTGQGVSVGSQNTTLRSLQTRLERVDLLGGAEYAPEVIQLSKLAWIKTGPDQYVLDVGTYAKTKAARRFYFTGNSLDQWWLTWQDEEGKECKRECFFCFSSAISIADRYVLGMCDPSTRALVLRDAPWKTSQAGVTDAQTRMLESHGFTYEQIQSLSKGKASQLIASIIAKKTGGKTYAGK